MTLAKAVLLLGAVAFVGIGLGFLVIPRQWAAIVEISVPTAMARTDLRATYGGFDLAVGLFLGWCAFRSQWIRPGLVALAFAAAGFAGGRLLGMLAEGAANRLMLIFFAIEGATLLVALYALRRLPRTP